MTGFYKDYADSSDTHQNSAEASADAAESAKLIAQSAASTATTKAIEATNAAGQAAASLAAQEDLEVTSASFDTADGTLTLTKANSGTVTTDLDGRYAELTGADFTGDVDIEGNLQLRDGDRIVIGDTIQDLYLTYRSDLGLGLISEGTELRLRAPTLKLQSTNDVFLLGEDDVNGIPKVSLNYNNIEKLVTTVNGVTVSGDLLTTGNSVVNGNSTVKGSVIFETGNFNSYPSIHHRIVEYPDYTSVNGLHIDGEDQLQLKSDFIMNLTCNGNNLRLFGSGGHKFLEGKLDSDSKKTTILYHGINHNSLQTVSDGILVDSKVEAELFKGDLEGAVHFKGAVASGATLTKGDVVYVSGHSGQKTEVDLADASDSSKMPAFGIVAADPFGGNVDVVTFGTLKTIDTSSYTDGDELFVDTTAGGLTATAPSGEGNLVQKIAKVVRADNSGNIKVMGAGRTNATPNLNDGNIFIGDSNNLATTASFATEVANATTGKANLSGATFTGNVGIGFLGSPQTLGVYGATSLYDELNVTGDITATSDVSISGTLNTDSIESTIDSVDYPVYSTSLDGSNAIATLGGTDTGNKVHTLEMRPAAGGVRMHWHQSGLYGSSPPPSGQTLRFHTTDRGIHVGDDLVGTYTAGDNQSNADLDFGMLVGRSSTNIGSNNFGFGYNHSFNHHNIASCLAAGSSITFHNKTLNSVGMGADVQVGEYNSPSTDPNRQAIFAGGNVVSAEGEYSFTWAKGDWGAGENSQVRYTATNRGTGCVLFGYQTKILSTCNYSLNGGSRGLSGEYKHQRLDDCDYTISWGFQNETDRSNSTAVFGQENDVADSSTTIVAGLDNTVKDSKYASVTGFSNASYCYGGVIGGQSNTVGYDVDDDTTGKYSACFGFNNLVEGDGNLVSGYENNTLGVGGACIGRGLKTPLFQQSDNTYAWDDYSITVGAYNSEATKYYTNTANTAWVEDHRFVVGTGTASNSKGNGFIVAVPTGSPLAPDFCGIIMPALASSTDYASASAAKAGGVPVGGLYRIGSDVKILLSTD